MSTVSIGCLISAEPAVTVTVDGKTQYIPPQKFLDDSGLGHFFFQLKPEMVRMLRREEIKKAAKKPGKKKKSNIEMSIGVLGMGVLDHPGSDLTPAELRAIGQVFLAAADHREQGGYGEIVCYDKGKELLAHIGLDHKDKEFPESGRLPLLQLIKVGK